MPLNAQQAQVASLLYTLASRRGLAPQRAREFVAAAMAESGLNPHARNRSSGAAGLYQLLSSGYRNRAQALGGVDNPRANALAILPDYQRYWASHPGARPGEAGAAVERSGMGAGFYARPLAQIGGGFAADPSPARPAAPATGAGLAAAPDFRPQLARALISQGSEPTQSYSGLISILHQRARAQVAAEAQNRVTARATQAGGAVSVGPSRQMGGSSHGGIAELLREGVGGPTHSTGPHVHLATTNAQAMLAALAEGRRLGLSERENPYVDPVDPVHAPHSYHNRRFPGRYNGRPLGQATDFSGSSAAMSAFYQWVNQHLR